MLIYIFNQPLLLSPPSSEHLAALLLLGLHLQILGLLHLLATLLLLISQILVFDDPVEIVKHVSVRRLYTKIFLDFDLTGKDKVSFERRATYIFGLVAEARTIRWIDLKVDCQELGDIHDCIADLMQLHGEALFKERRENFVVVINNLRVEGICRRSHFTLSMLSSCRWRDELVLFDLSWDRRWDRWIHRELHGHLVVVGEHCHCTLVTDNKVDKCSDQLPRSELLRLIVNGHGIKVSDKRAVPIVRVQCKLAEG